METEGFYMAEKRWRTWETVGLLVVLAAGNLLHFIYDWTGQSPIAAPLAAVNESTWEHMKLFITPWVLLAFWVSWSVQARRVLDGPVWQILGGVTLLAVWGLAIWWTYAPPQLPLFVDPTDGSRGIPLR